MTLEELLGLASKASRGEVELSLSERIDLMALLKVYADEILAVGQVIEQDSVILSKATTGKVSVRIDHWESHNIYYVPSRASISLAPCRIRRISIPSLSW